MSSTEPSSLTGTIEESSVEKLQGQTTSRLADMLSELDLDSLGITMSTGNPNSKKGIVDLSSLFSILQGVVSGDSDPDPESFGQVIVNALTDNSSDSVTEAERELSDASRDIHVQVKEVVCTDDQ